MKRAKLGDTYAVKVPNGYKIFQWAYDVPQKGEYIRVFSGLYASVPENLAEIVAGPHSYIVYLYVRRAHRVGLAKWVGNFPVPEKYPFPAYEVVLFQYEPKNIGAMRISSTNRTSCEGREVEYFDVSRIQDLPEKYQTDLLGSCVTPPWLLYLFDVDFSLAKPEYFFPNYLLQFTDYKDTDALMQKYKDIVDAVMDRQKGKNTSK